MNRRCYLKYACGKLFELKIPIVADINGENTLITPEDSRYFELAKKKFQVGDIEVVEKDIPSEEKSINCSFISLVRKSKIY